MKVYIYINFISVGGSDTSNNDRNNVETQRKGIVVVAYSINLSNSNENDNENNNNELAYIDRMERMKAYYILGKVVPQRMAAMHICLPNVQIFGVVASFYGIAFKLFNARTSIHARTKLYAGNPIEIRYKLQQHGKHYGANMTTGEGESNAAIYVLTTDVDRDVLFVLIFFSYFFFHFPFTLSF
ncbi:MAG: hypothetical protein ACI8RD_011521 [Bacillariaceae sp.]